MAALGAMVLRNQGRPLLTYLLAAVRVAVGQMSKGFVRPAITYAYWCFRTARHQGIKGLVITLKALNTSLAQSIARDLKHFPPHPRVKRGRLGLPTLIPSLHRERIAKGDTTIIRYWFTLFALYRALEFPGKINLSTITSPGPCLNYFLPEWSEFTQIFWKELKRMGAFPKDFNSLKFLRTLTVRPFLIARTTPTNVLYVSTSLNGLVFTAKAWLAHPYLLQVFRDWLQLTGNSRFSNWFEDWLRLGPSFAHKDAQGRDPELGKLGLKDEPAGKVRVFAMVDPFTQWALKPLHDFLFSILRKIPQDGTFDQLAPVKRLQTLDKTRFWSYDLSSATDRLPVLLQAVLLSPLITAHGANLWMTLLVGRSYSLPGRVMKMDPDREPTIGYAVGQPMGALTSWAMLAITHHALVQYASWLVSDRRKWKWFEYYAVLGDDIVIADPQVAASYSALMNRIEVGIQPSKSVRDERGYGVLEFAKRIFFRRESVGPVSLFEVLAAAGSLPAWLEVVRKYSLTLTQGLMVLGFGYRAVSRVNQLWSAMPRRLQGHVVSYYGPGGPGFGGSILDWMSTGSKDPKPLDKAHAKEIILQVRQRLEDLIPRARALTKLVEVDRTRAHYGTTKWENWQLPTFLNVMNPEFSGSAFPKAVRRNPTALWGSNDRDSLTEDQKSALMSMLEYCYRETFYDLLSDLRGIERSLDDLQSSGDFENLAEIISLLQSKEDEIDALGLAPSLTIRNQVPRKATSWQAAFRGRPTPEMKGVWLRRWRSWRRASRPDQ